MFGGKLLPKTRKMLPGSLKQYDWSDAWTDTIDIDYDGDLSDPTVQKAIADAFKASRFCGKQQSSWGALRWSNGDKVLGIDVDKRQLLISCSCQLAD